MSNFDLPENPDLQGKIIEGRLQHETRRLERGALGYLFGAGTEKPGNIAGAAIMISFIALIALVWAPDSNVYPKRELVTLFGGIITGALGFLFGRSTS